MIVGAVAVLLATAALVGVALLHVRDDAQDARLDALERERAPDDLGTLPAEVDPPRDPIGFRRDPP